MKKIIAFCLIITAISAISGCSNNEYSDTVPCSKILDVAEEQIPINLGYESYDGDHIEYYFDGTELDDDHSLRYSVLSENINEIGIFHAPDKKALDGLCELTEKYLDELLEDKKAFIASYAPEELPKLENAEVRTFGNYVAYAILDEDDREVFFDTVEAVLKKEGNS